MVCMGGAHGLHHVDERAARLRVDLGDAEHGQPLERPAQVLRGGLVGHALEAREAGVDRGARVREHEGVRPAREDAARGRERLRGVGVERGLVQAEGGLARGGGRLRARVQPAQLRLARAARESGPL